MSSANRRLVGIGTAATLAMCFLSYPLYARADAADLEDLKIRQGLLIAPVPLDLRGKNRELVGLGSYIVNAQAACNDCHTNPSFAPGGDPYKGEPKQVNAAGYLGGGVPFGPFVSRNLTPDASGRAVGGDSFELFKLVMQRGIDLSAQHPQFGPLLQVMPWSAYQDMSERDLRAIYEYLSSIPCVEGPPGAPPNRCR